MSLTLASMLLLAQNCAPAVAPETLISVAQVESRFDPLTIGVNGRAPRALHPASREAAIEAANRLIAAGGNIDLGLAQINSRNLGWLGLTVADAFDPCRNLAAAAKVLVANYSGTSQTSGEQAALKAAISMYNTGDRSRGFRNGYVQKVSRAAAYIVPALAPEADVGEPAASPSSDAPEAARPVTLTAAEPEPPSWDVFARSQTREVLVFKASAAKAASPRPLPSSRKTPGARHDR